MTNSSRTVRVNLGPRSYDIDIQAGLLDHLGPFLAARRTVSHAIVITDENVEEHARRAAESLASPTLAVDLLVIEPGEQSKSIEAATDLWQALLELGADRKTIVVAVGGGVVGDLAGFIAATYARGLDFLQVPTTLLAQVDSSVGGKVGVNLPGAKNIVGAFLQPLGVLIDPATLHTLPPREYRSGLGEVVKYGVILDEEFFSLLEANVGPLLERKLELLEQVIARCCRLKADVVAGDEREETGLRAVLNYGHTFGHALETLTGYEQLLHGEAVSIGMLCASRLAERLGYIDAEVTRRQAELLSALGLPVNLPEVDHDQILATMMHDKKVEHGRLRFVLPTALGRVELVGDIDPDQVRASLA
ncbi:MAG: 3-dehydroquinate synthase [Pirellulales bacterium]